MDSIQALTYLQKNQPLPDDDFLGLEIKEFREVIEFYEAHPDSKCIPYFLNIFGSGSGFGLYQTIGNLLKLYDDSLVIPELKRALSSESPSIRYWCAVTAQLYDSIELIDGLAHVFEIGDVDAQCAALTALSDYEDTRVHNIALIAANSTDEDLSEIGEDVLLSFEEA